MSGKSGIKWTMKEFAKALRERQFNEFDVNIGVSGKRGDGKSTFIHKLMREFSKDGFKNKKHQVYTRERVIQLLSSQKFGFCWDDEAINSGYKRDFQNAGQKDLIKIVTNFRDNYNIYASAIPSFYSLDKDLRDLIFVHVHIIERGVAVLLFALEDQIHSSDIWDSKNNMDFEKKENKRISDKPHLKFRYHKFSTFGGYIFFNDVTEKQKKLYKEVKRDGRKDNFKGTIDESFLDNRNANFYENCMHLIKEGKLTTKGLQQACLVDGRKYSAVRSELNRRFKDEGFPQTLKVLMEENDSMQSEGPKKRLNKVKGAISDLVPTLTP